MDGSVELEERTSGVEASVAYALCPEQRKLLRQALLIRGVEEQLLALFGEGRLNGTVHTCVGQEWVGVALAAAIRPGDAVCSNHRGHGHFLGVTGDVGGLIAEVMGRTTGVCGGAGGSQHLHARDYFSNGIQGGMAPVAAGLALARSLDGDGSIAVSCVGDGTLGEGTFYEALNLASIWSLPLLVMVENNGWAQSTDAATTTSGDVAGRAGAFGIPYLAADTWHVEDLLATVRRAADTVRSSGGPVVLEVRTFRLNAHSKSDDNRPVDLVERYRERDVLERIVASGDPVVAALRAEIADEIDAAVAAADAAPLCDYEPAPLRTDAAPSWQPLEPRRAERSAARIHTALARQLEDDPGTVFIGEDIEGPYGGAFKISRDLSQRFAGRVRNTPISEAAIVGIATGLCLAGRRAIVEIMFGDFLTLTLDQLLQHASKFQEMFGRHLAVPLVVRTPMGGRRGYGPTHSQSLEKHFLGVPNLLVLALGPRVDPAAVYGELFAHVTSPALVIENKVLYTRPLDAPLPAGYTAERTDSSFPTVRLAPRRGRAAVTLFCYGLCLTDVEEALGTLFVEDEVLCEVISPTQLSPLDVGPLLESVRRTGRLVTVEEGSGFAALGSEAVAALAERGAAPTRLARVSFDGVIPCSLERELALLPSPAKVVAAVREVLR